jgi:catechol 2,3-dioxygenase-like lactoylglutathione lyase family enzyme
MKFVRGLIVVCLLAFNPAYAETLVTAGYQEVVFSVSNLADYQAFFEETAAWDVIEIGKVSRSQLEAWGLDDSVTASEVLLGNAESARGFVRLVDFDGAEQQQIRSSAQPWDTGGWFDVNSRILSMSKKFAEFQALDWQAASDPVEFTFGPFVVKEWLARGPDGIVIAMIERVAPPLEGWPNIREMSRFFNATQIVPDIAAARDFYINKLGFEAYLHHNGASAEPGPNVLGIPYNLADDIVRSVSIVHPHGLNEGSVELLSYNGLQGADWSARAKPPNLGILMLRFPVADIDAFYQHVQNEKIEIAYPPAVIRIKPYGQLKIMAVRGPGGAWLEFFEAQ